MTDATQCPRCGRPRRFESGEDLTWICPHPGSVDCDAARDNYRRGLRDCLALAKKHAFCDWTWNAEEQHVNWSKVDAEVEKALGEASR